MAGINPVEDKPGFRHIKLTPMPDYRFKYVKSNYNSTVGVYESQWEITEEGNLNFKFVIPFNATASLILPDAKLENVKVNNKLLKDTELKSSQSNKNISVELTSGSYEFNYLLEVAYIKYYGIDVSLGELATNKDVKRIVGEKLPMMMAEDMLERSGHESLRELSFAPFSPVTNEILEELDMKLGKIKTSVI